MLAATIRGEFAGRSPVPGNSPLSAFSEIIIALCNLDSAAISKCLKNNLSLLLQRDYGNKLFLHRALEVGNELTLETILQCARTLPPNKFDKLMHELDPENNTVLHLAARYGNEKTLSMIIDALGSSASTEALRLNKQKKLPLDVLVYNPNTNIKSMSKLLKSLTIKKPISQLNTAIHFKELLETHPELKKADIRLLNNLHYACIAATHIRNIILTSYTFQGNNGLTKQQFQQLEKLAKDQRLDLTDELKKIPCTDTNDEKQIAKLELIEAFVKTHKQGRCWEYSYLVLNTLRKLGVKVPIEIMHLHRGDHVFVVLGRDLKSDFHDYTKWGPQAVVIDAQNGQVYPAAEIPQKMHAFKFYRNHQQMPSKIILIPYDKKIHSFCVDSQFSPRFFTLPRKNTYPDFSLAEKTEIANNEALLATLAPPQSYCYLV
jgi:hypothetical protein